VTVFAKDGSPGDTLAASIGSVGLPREKSVLHMTLKREWLKKKKEYRAQNRYWESRLMRLNYDEIIFRNGYGKNVPEMRVQFLGVTRRGMGKSAVFVLRLGRVIEKKRFGNR
jgi:hypothetical protein